jgi:hypothetical protein
MAGLGASMSYGRNNRSVVSHNVEMWKYRAKLTNSQNSTCTLFRTGLTITAAATRLSNQAREHDYSTRTANSRARTTL